MHHDSISGELCIIDSQTITHILSLKWTKKAEDVKERQRLLKSWNTNYATWKNHQGLWFTFNENHHLEKGTHWQTLGIQFIKRKRHSYRTRSSSKSPISELKWYIFDSKYFPVRWAKLDKKLSSVRNFLKMILKVNALVPKTNPTQISFNPMQADGSSCGLYCSVAAEAFDTYITNYASSENKQMQTIKISRPQIKKRRQRLSEDVLRSAEAAQVAISHDRQKEKIVADSEDDVEILESKKEKDEEEAEKEEDEEE